MLWSKAIGAGGIVGTGGGGSAPSFVGANSVFGSSSVSIDTISGIQESDVILFSGSDDTAGFSMSSSGWDGMIGAFPNSFASNSISFLTAYKVMGSTIDTNAEVSNTLDTVAVAVFRGISTVPSGVDTSASTSGSSISLGSMAVSVDNSIAVLFAYIDDDEASIDTLPAGYSLATEVGRSGGSVAILYKTRLSIGTETPGTITWDSSDNLLALGYILSP
jgi:hypothetical protein